RVRRAPRLSGLRAAIFGLSQKISDLRRERARERATRTERAGAAARERAGGGGRGAGAPRVRLSPGAVTPSVRVDREAGGGVGLRRTGTVRLAAEFADADAALVRGEEIHEAPVVAGRHPEQLDQRLVASARFAEAAAHELAQVVARHVAREEHRIDVL